MISDRVSWRSAGRGPAGAGHRRRRSHPPRCRHRPARSNTRRRTGRCPRGPARHAGGDVRCRCAPPQRPQHPSWLSMPIAGLLVDLGDRAAGPRRHHAQRRRADTQIGPGVLGPRLAPRQHEVGPEAVHAERLGRVRPEVLERSGGGHEDRCRVGERRRLPEDVEVVGQPPPDGFGHADQAHRRADERGEPLGGLVAGVEGRHRQPEVGTGGDRTGGWRHLEWLPSRRPDPDATVVGEGRVARSPGSGAGAGSCRAGRRRPPATAGRRPARSPRPSPLGARRPGTT